VPAAHLVRPEELPAYAVLGIVGALASAVFSKAIQFSRPRLKSLPRWTFFVQPALAGLIIGAIGYFGAPQVMGAGYQYIDEAMHSHFTWQMLGALAGLKILSTALSFSSGTPGGMFAPTLFIGAMLGGAVGGIEHLIFPHLSGPVGTYALVGMGVLFAGFLRAPMTSVFMVLEVSGDYSIIVPVIIANTLAYLISRALQPVPIFDLLTRQDGLVLPSLEEQREQKILRVEDAMRLPDLPVVSPQLAIAAALARMEAANRDALLVDNRPAGWAGFSREERLAASENGNANLPLTELATRRIAPVLHPDHTLDTALRILPGHDFLPVVHRAPPQPIVGILSVGDVLAAYRRAGLALAKAK
jgi:CIC family chloride channel protein